MGLLDQWAGDTDMQSPQNQYLNTLAATLLQAGGPSRMPISLGQALGSALGASQQAYQSAEDRALMRQMRQQDLALKNLQEKRAQQQFDVMQQGLAELNGSPSSMPQTAQQSQAKNDWFTGASDSYPMPQQPQQGQVGSEARNLNAIKKIGFVDPKAAEFQLALQKYANDPMQLQAGNTYVNRMTGAREYVPKIGEGARINAQGQYEQIPRYAETNAEIERAKAAATEGVKAGYDFQPMSISQPVQLPNGQILQPGTYSLSKAQIAEINNAQQAQFNAPRQAPQGQPMQGQAPTQGLPQPMNPTQAEFVDRTATFRAAQPKEYNDRIKIYQDELAKETDPVAIGRLNREITRLKKEQATGSELPSNFAQPQGMQQAQAAPQPQQAFNQPRFGIQIQSEAEKQAAIEAAKKATALQYDPQIKGAEGRTATDVEREKAKPQAYAQLQGVKSGLKSLADLANEIINSPAVGDITGVSGRFPNFPGGAAADLAAKLETLKSKVGFNVLSDMRQMSPTGGALGSVSDQENKMLQNNLAAIDTSQSPKQFRNSVAAIRDYAQAAQDRLDNAFKAHYGDTQSNPALQDVTQKTNAAQRKTISLSDIAATARASGRSTAEVTAAAKAKGYIIGGN